MGIIRTIKTTGNYFIAHKSYINDDRLTFKAKGIMTYLFSKPDDWTIYQSEVAKSSKDGKGSVGTAFKELIELGYLTKEIKRKENGDFDGYNYTLYEEPKEVGENQKMEIAKMGNAKSGTTNNYRTNNYNNLERESDQNNKVDCITTYQDKIGNISPNTMQKLLAWKDDFNMNNQGEEIVSEAITQSSNENAKSFSYIDNKLKRYLKANVKTLDDAKAQSKENKPNKKQRNNSWLDDELGGK